MIKKEDLKNKLNIDTKTLKNFEETYKEVLEKYDSLKSAVAADKRHIENDAWMTGRCFKFKQMGDMFYIEVLLVNAREMVCNIIRDITPGNTCGNFKSERIIKGGIQKFASTKYQELTKDYFDYLWNKRYKELPEVEGYFSKHDFA